MDDIFGKGTWWQWGDQLLVVGEDDEDVVRFAEDCEILCFYLPEVNLTLVPLTREQATDLVVSGLMQPYTPCDLSGIDDDEQTRLLFLA